MDEYVKNEIYKPLGLKRTTYLPLANGFTTEDVAATSFGNPYEYAMVDEIDYPGFGYDCTADLDAFRTFTGWRNYTLQASATTAMHGWQTAAWPVTRACTPTRKIWPCCARPC